jgi:membrane fusion protein (multidrug efflux system)
VAGYLKTITVDKGDWVNDGQVLAEIEVPEMAADLAKYRAELEVAEIDYRRVRDAQNKAPDLVMVQAVDTAKAKYDVAKANLDRLETLLGFAKIIAPFSGVISRRMVDPGAFIPAATSSSAAQSAALVTVTDSSRIRVQVAVPESEVPFIRIGLPVQVTVEELRGRVFAGSVTRYTHTLDDATKTMLTEIEILNPKGELYPGMYASVRLELERKKDVLLLPAEALVVEKTRTSVFAVQDNKAVKVPVKPGFNDGVLVEVVEGLKAEQLVVLAGKQTITDGQSVTAVEAK